MSPLPRLMLLPAFVAATGAPASIAVATPNPVRVMTAAFAPAACNVLPIAVAKNSLLL